MTTRGIRTRSDIRLRCDVDVDTGCWRWRGARSSCGRASLRLACCGGKVTTLGQAACFFRTGLLPPRGIVWHPTCKTMDCANPAHRTPGTRSSQLLRLELTRSPVQRARMSQGRVASVGKLTPADVDAIRGMVDVPLAEIAARFGISETWASDVRAGKKRVFDRGAIGSSAFTWRPEL